ncbi:TadE/TadG family type IV pilus assembly protein [Pseudohalocynthiibacter aestuariivivens]|uniref:TadE/TadG family type IV pilus assembly protein n=1 Tax=Pseudohalocynthiibacter aestuariivivens TaxID=1591409 RepID=A0ABV5JLE1_9RHOB|nr:pilus assembly protein TadG-related protein [Pseudohalocynthiibacter aestuariivivens]
MYISSESDQEFQFNFLTDENGAMTIFGLFVFVVMIFVSAVAVDVANLMAARNQLQVAADTAAHAALYFRDTNDEDAAKAKAVELASAGMPVLVYGEVLSTDDVQFGTWDFDAQAFSADSTSRTAVMVTTRRLSERSNSIASYLFQFAGKSDWDVITSAVFTTYKPTCFREGFVADDVVDIQSNNGYSNGFCIHSNEYVSVNLNNTFEPGTVVSMPNMDEIDLPQSGFENNDGLQAALRSGVYRLRIINKLDGIIAGLAVGSDKYIPDYITSDEPVVILGGHTLDEDDFIPGRIHTMHCTGAGKVTISPTVPLTEIVFVSDCEVKFGAGTILQDVVIATTDTGATSMNSPASFQIGRDDNCAEGGGAQLLSLGGMDFAAGLKMFGGQIIAKGDVEFSAEANGIEGASIISASTISGTSNMEMAFCGTGMEDNFEAEYFRLAG